MSQVLSQSEVDALLAAVSEGEIGQGEGGGGGGGVVLVREAGGSVTTYQGEDYRLGDNTLLSGNADICSAIRARIHKLYGLE